MQVSFSIKYLFYLCDYLKLVAKLEKIQTIVLFSFTPSYCVENDHLLNLILMQVILLSEYLLSLKLFYHGCKHTVHMRKMTSSSNLKEESGDMGILK